jgi:Rrf2 family protein
MTRPEEAMKLSSACTYAVRALAFLARHEGDGLLVAHVFAGARGMPEEYLHKTLKGLVRAGILLSSRGPTGGYRLARPAKRISLLDIVEAVDGPVRGEVPRWAAGAEGARLDARLQEVCDAAAEVVRARLRKVSIADLAAEGARSAG